MAEQEFQITPLTGIGETLVAPLRISPSRNEEFQSVLIIVSHSLAIWFFNHEGDICMSHHHHVSARLCSFADATGDCGMLMSHIQAHRFMLVECRVYECRAAERRR